MRSCKGSLFQPAYGLRSVLLELSDSPGSSFLMATVIPLNADWKALINRRKTTLSVFAWLEDLPSSLLFSSWMASAVVWLTSDTPFCLPDYSRVGRTTIADDPHDSLTTRPVDPYR